jgi:NADPH-dependent 2,4-dienoyl-CoA reductase/sulfur reductase-like enzyme
LKLVDAIGADWTRPRSHPDGHVYDVVIVGGGQSGLATAYGLKRERVNNILILDESKEGLRRPWEPMRGWSRCARPRG